MADIYVNAAAVPGGDGASLATAYTTIREAVDEANTRTGGATIRVAEGTYLEPPNVAKVAVPNVRIFGSSVLERDERGLPTGVVSAAATYMPDADGTLLTVTAPGCAIAGMVFVGRLRVSSVSKTTLLFVDGGGQAAIHRSLDGISIHENCFTNATQGMILRLANASVAGNFIAGNVFGFQSLGGFEPDAGQPREQRVTFEGNRVQDNINVGATFNGQVGSKLPPSFAPGPGLNDVTVMGNDFTGNGDARTPLNGIYYPQPIQYTALLFLVMHGENSEPAEGGRVRAAIRRNSFNKNGYGVTVALRLPLTAATRGYSLDATLSENTYCSNGLNNLFADFSVPSQSHLAAAGGNAFRYAIDTVYRIDASADGLGLDDLDYDHPVADPRLPTDAPGALLLGNTLIFNGQVVPPLPTHAPTDAPPKVTRPRPLNSGGFQPISTLDRAPPIIRSAVAVPAVLWPPDHRMVPVTILVDAVDRCSGVLSFDIRSVTSSAVFGDVEPDWLITGPLSLLLRAERNPAIGPPRVRTYSIEVGCTDQAGNSSTATVMVSVGSRLLL